MMATVSTLKKFHVGSKKMRPESGRMENWYVIAIPKIDLLAGSRLGPRVRICTRTFGGCNDAREQTTMPASLDGCPMFAMAYMGRKERGEAPSKLLSTGKGCCCEQELSGME
jgi:hypothetical protein